MKIEAKLMNIQQKLKAPKGQYNDYGKYYYRSCEDILEAVKPHLEEEKVILLVTDNILEVSGRFYVEATAKLVDIESGETICNTAYAREEETKKGMDASQITGSCSSYARKYAMNGLFLIDDNRDADTRDNTEKKADPKPEDKISEGEVSSLIKKCEKEKISVAKVCELYKVKSLTDLTPKQYSNIQKFWEKVKERAAE